MAPFDFATLRSGRTDVGALRLRYATLRTNGCGRPSTLCPWPVSWGCRRAQDERYGSCSLHPFVLSVAPRQRREVEGRPLALR